MTSDKADPQPQDDQGPELTHPQDTGSDMLTEALRCALRGWPVLPLHGIRDGKCTCPKGVDCGSPGKHPRTLNGVKDATTYLETIRLWWTKWPDANVGIATGKVSGLLVLDVDPQHDGDDSLDALIDRYGPLPDTIEVLTGGGGRHIYFAYPHAGVIRNSVSELGPGLDVRSDGGYVVAPGSMHASGQSYEWELSSQPDDTALAPPPPWMVDALTVTTNGSPRSGDGGGGNGRVDPARVLNGVPEGERNTRIFELASRHRGLGLSIEEARALALAAAAAATPPLSEGEAIRIVNGVYPRYESGGAPGSMFVEGAILDSGADRFTIYWGNNVENLPTPEWLIEGIVTKGSFGFLFGKPGSGKTLTVLDMAASVASGQPWQGHDTLQGPVIYIAAEGVGDLGLRHEALRIGRELDDLPDLGYITEPVNLYTGGDVGYLIEMLNGRRPALIIADTLARSMDGGDENFAKDVNAVIKNVDLIRHTTGAAVMLIHHPGQDERRERGSTALKGAADVVIKLAGDVTSTVTLRCEKMKMAAPFENVSIRFEKTGPSLAVVSGGVTPILTDNERNGLTLVSDESLSHKGWCEAFDEAGYGSRATFNRTLRTLKEKGFVEDGDGVHENLYGLTKTGVEALGITGANEVSGDK